MKFDAPKKYQEVMRRKYRDFVIEGPAFKINGSTFGISRKHADSLKSSDAEIILHFSKMALHLLNTCVKYQVPITLQDVCVLQDNEIDSALVKYNAKNGKTWNLLFLPNCRCTVAELCFHLKVFHELFHAWTGLKYQSLEDEEIFTELVATVALKRAVQTPEAIKIYKDLTSNPKCSYIARSNKRAMMQDPEQALRDILETTSGGTIHVS